MTDDPQPPKPRAVALDEQPSPPPPPPPVKKVPIANKLRGDKPVARAVEVATILAAGFFGNVALRTTLASVAATIAAVLVAAALLLGGRLSQRSARLLVLGAVSLAPWLIVRSSPALTAVTMIAIVAMFAVAGGMSRSGSFFDARVREFAGHTGALAYEWMYGVAMVERLAKKSTADHKLTALLRGVVIAAPVFIVFAMLLASADDVFASVLLLGDLPDLVGHLVLSLLVAVASFALVSRGAHETARQGTVDLRLLGPLEVLMILGGLVVLFSAFVLTQVVVAAGGADHLLETEGLTAADHARRGFFQLLWVAGLSTALVGTLRAMRMSHSGRGRDRFTPLALITLALTLVIALISMQRLGLYIGSFGLTPLRIWAMLGAGTIAVLVAIFASSIAGWRAEQSWFPGVAFLAGIGLVVGLNVLNPDAYVARYNIESRSTSGLDSYALGRLSDDAVPTLVSHLSQLDPEDRSVLTSELCRRAERQTSFGSFEYNRGAVRAEHALVGLCQGWNR